MIVAPYVRSVGHVFAYLYTLDDDSECPMDNETYLLPNVFPSKVIFDNPLRTRALYHLFYEIQYIYIMIHMMRYSICINDTFCLVLDQQI